MQSKYEICMNLKKNVYGPKLSQSLNIQQLRLLPSCLSVPSEHVASLSKWQSADLDLVTQAKKKSVWPALFRGNVHLV